MRTLQEARYSPEERITTQKTFVNLIERLLLKFSTNLKGIVIFGSWARGEATVSSDCDVLVVLSEVIIEREMYRELDRWNLHTSGGQKLELQLVALPKMDAVTSGLFAEVSIDGIIVYERDFAISRYLRHIRRQIADGLLIRRYTYGQPYWVHKESERP